MRASRSIPWAVSILSVFWATFPDAAAGNTIFGRVSNVFAPGSTTGGGSTTTSMSSGSATADNTIGDELEELGDAFEEDGHLSQILRLMDGDDFGVVQDVWKSKGMEQLFTDPQGLRTMLTAMPMLKAFKGVEEIAAKETLTPEDVSYTQLKHISVEVVGILSIQRFTAIAISLMRLRESLSLCITSVQSGCGA